MGSEALIRLKTCLFFHVRGSNSQSFAPFLPSSFQNKPTAFRSASDEESVRALATYFARLVGSFHKKYALSLIMTHNDMGMHAMYRIGRDFSMIF